MLSLQFELIEPIALRQQASSISHDILLQITSKQIAIHNVYSKLLTNTIIYLLHRLYLSESSHTIQSHHTSEELYLSILLWYGSSLSCNVMSMTSSSLMSSTPVSMWEYVPGLDSVRTLSFCLARCMSPCIHNHACLLSNEKEFNK